MTDLTELNKLEQYLKDHNIEYERFDEDEGIHPSFKYIRTKFGRHQICVPNDKDREWDAICQFGSYGHNSGLLEIMGSIVRADSGDSVEGYLTADDVIERIEKRNKNESNMRD